MLSKRAWVAKSGLGSLRCRCAAFSTSVPTCQATAASTAAIPASKPPPAPARGQPSGPDSQHDPTSSSSSSPLRPQPFVPRAASRSFQIASLSRERPGSTSTTINLQAHNGTQHTLTVPNLFLRDSSTHPEHVHPSSRQKLFRTTDVPREADVKGFGVHEINGEDHLVVEWTTKVRGVDPKSADLSVTPLSTLLNVLRRDGDDPLRLPSTTEWTRSELDQRLQKWSFDRVLKDDRTTLDLLNVLLTDGIAFVRDVPCENKSGQYTDLRTLVERLASIRNTWYGNLFDVKAEAGSKNIAYTNLDLGLHMDLTHFETPPRYQFLHSMLNSGVTGGSSYFVDSYSVAQRLRRDRPDAFETLCTEPVLFSYESDAHHTRFVRPTIELVPGTDSEIQAVNYSPPFQGPLPLTAVSRESAMTRSSDADRLARLHDALSLFADACDDEANRYSVQLQPGDCVIFDNRRVLHARTAFDFDERPADKERSIGKQLQEQGRWLKGAYCDGDEVRSLWRVLEGKRRKGLLK